MAATRFDLLILGGGLAGGLLALAAKRAKPKASIAIVEPGTIGGNHLWSFFDSDVDAEGRALVQPLVARQWRDHEVRFPGRRRIIANGYYSITSENLAAAIEAAAIAHIEARADVVEPGHAILADGRELHAGEIVDARGWQAGDGFDLGWQKFVGQMIETTRPHGIERPVIMDAEVNQDDGYRFVYLLPFSETKLFVEDTYYQDDPKLDVKRLVKRIQAYCDAQDWTVKSVGREETGVLPVVKRGRLETVWPSEDKVARAGVRTGLFHPLTSYSLPFAVRAATRAAEAFANDIPLQLVLRGMAEANWKKTRFDRMLARMLFDAANPWERWRILARFYRLPASLIARFYAGDMTLFDRIRILVGKPPVKIGAAVRAILS